MLLVVGAGLFARTLINLNTTNLGFDPHNLLLFSIQAPPARYPAPQDIALHQRIEERLAQVPGVQSVTLIENPLISHNISNITFLPSGQPKPTGDEQDRDVNGVGQTFFDTYRIPILYGRGFGPTDTATSPLVAVINQSLAHAVYPGVDPVGKTFTSNRHLGDREAIYQIIGVSADAKYDQLQEDPPPTFYTLYRQAEQEQFINYTVKTQLSPADILPALRNAVQSIDKDIPLRDIRTQTEQIEASILQQRLFATLTAGFGLLALALACVGIYGIMAYTVSQRTNEIGIRLALGAERRQVRGMVLREAGRLALLGVLAGLAAALGLGQLVKSMLYGLKPADPLSFSGSSCLLLAVALIAAWIPALRASRVEPMEALRHE